MRLEEAYCCCDEEGIVYGGLDGNCIRKTRSILVFELLGTETASIFLSEGQYLLYLCLEDIIY